MRILCVHAHFDDFEFVAAGLFEMWKRKLGERLRARVIVCTDGKAGHHERSREETGRIRIREQEESARLGGYEFAPLRLPNGEIPREAGLHSSRELLAALWKAIRDFEPDYLFCPPIPVDPLAGVHVDHLAVAESVRQVAYLINVPHAFTPEYPAEEAPARPRKTPVILNVHDAYMAGTNSFDLAVDVEEAFSTIRDTTYCHRSQIEEWLPWVGRHRMEAPRSIEDWEATLRERLARRNRELGIDSERAVEVFTVTAWGRVPEIETLTEDFPNLMEGPSNLGRLKERLDRWQNL